MSEFLTDQGLSGDVFGRGRAGPARGFEDHPVASTLDDDLRVSVVNRGRVRCYASGAVLPDGEPTVRFVLSGALGSFAAVDFLCLSYFGPGAVTGLEGAVDAQGPRILQAVVDAEVFEISAKALVGAIGRREAERLLARSAVERLAEAEIEMTCLASHGVGARLARWLLRLHALDPRGCILMSQERLSQLLGVQRTSVNAVAHPLQERKIVRYRRGRISVLDVERLKTLACPCAQAGPS